MLARNLLEISFSFEVKNDMLFDTFVETDKRWLVGCTFHVSTDKKIKKIKKKNSHKFYCCFRKLSDGFNFSFRYYDYDYGGCSM